MGRLYHLKHTMPDRMEDQSYGYDARRPVLWRMFKSLRKASEALQDLAGTLNDIEDVLRSRLGDLYEGRELDDRLDTLERSRATWEAEAEAQFLRADALFKNARASEERGREMKKKKNAASNGGIEGTAEMLEAYQAAGLLLPSGDAEGGSPEGVPPVRKGMGVHSRKAPAMRAKFG